MSASYLNNDNKVRMHTVFEMSTSMARSKRELTKIKGIFIENKWWKADWLCMVRSLINSQV